MVHDVFISAKSADYAYAQQVYKMLTENGIRAFFSHESLPELGNSDYRKEIDRKLEESQHMVVVVSSVENANSPYVEAEWGFFVNEKRSGRKSGNLVTLTVGSLESHQLPASLRYYEVIRFDDPSACEKLRRYLAPRVREDPTPSAATGIASANAYRTNSLGNVFVRVPMELLPAGHKPGLAVYVSTTCVTNQEYMAFVNDGHPEPRWPRKYRQAQHWREENSIRERPQNPVVFVSQSHAIAFCDWLTREERARRSSGGGIEGHERYVLPTLPLWKSIARSAPLTDDAVIDRVWLPGSPPPTEKVRSGTPTLLGLYCLYGNVFEWCQDHVEKKIRLRDKHDELVTTERCWLAMGGGWASSRDWLRAQIQKRTYGGVWCLGGAGFKDGGFRLWLFSKPPQ